MPCLGDSSLKINSRKKRCIKTDAKIVPLVGSLPKCPQNRGWAQVTNMSQKLSSGLPGKWQGLNYLNHYLLPLTGLHYQELESEASTQTVLRHTDVG